jgi:hypothetical protein
VNGTVTTPPEVRFSTAGAAEARDTARAVMTVEIFIARIPDDFHTESNSQRHHIL